jgi:hypothetical protein
MHQTIHFEDDLFFVNELINALEEGLNVKLDRQFFFDKIVEDIFFLDATINKLAEALRENTQFVQVQQLMRSLQVAKLKFTELLGIILSGSSGMEDAFSPFNPKLRTLMDSHSEDVEQIRESYLAAEENSTPLEGISREEYRFLFPEEEPEE